MLYAGRPELPLPPAPDTPGLCLCRLFLASAGSALLTLGGGLTAFWFRAPDSYGVFLAIVAVPAPVWVLTAFFYLSVRQLHEERYWTAERVAQRCPAIWHLYTACNTDVAIGSRHAVRPRR